MDREFQAARRQLNTAQRQAVDTIDGPVLVVAGPGTGKTQLLSLRVANILQKTDTDPSSVLCLTFTNFAATNVRERLGQLVGPGAQNVMVHTFHSFAGEVMNLYPDYFWQGARLKIAPDAVQLQTIRSILADLPPKNPLALQFAGVYTAVDDVQQALRLTKEAGLTPDKLTAMLAVNEAYLDIIEPQLVDILDKPLHAKKLLELQAAVEALPEQPIDAAVTPLLSLSRVIKDGLTAAIETDLSTGKTTHTGHWKRQWVQSAGGQKGMVNERKRNAWWRALAGVYARYREQLYIQEYYDYADMLVEVIAQLEQHPELLADVQERFLHVLIDEFQDTNAAQFRLAHLVASHHADNGRPNLMAVGDDDQSIFAFNGAELNNMLAFRRTYPATKTIVLTDNYRSTQAILDAATGVIEQAEDRLVKRDPSLSKQLRARARVPQGDIIRLHYPTRQHQMTAVAGRVKAAWQQPSKPSVAVLARQHRSLREISALLQQAGIPVAYEQQNNVLEQPLVQQIVGLAHLVQAIREGDTEQVNYYLFHLLQHEVWQVSNDTLWQLTIANRRRPDWLDSLLKHHDLQLNNLARWLQWLARQAEQENLAVMWDYLIGLRAGEHLTSPLRAYFLDRQVLTNDYLTGLSGLHALREVVSDFAAAQNRQPRLTDFIHLVQTHESLNKPITDESWFISGDRTVQVMTVHKAKGLEFDTVFLLDAVDNTWRPRHIGRKPPANLPMQPYGEQYDDYVRLLYVAVTRAKRSFIVSSYQADGKGQAVLPTPLIAQLPEQPAEALEPLEVLESTLAWPQLETTDQQALLKSLLSDYRLSATALTHFLDVTTGGPQHFLERHILRLPERKTATMAFGTAIHGALQAAQSLTDQGNFSVKEVQAIYTARLREQMLTRADFERYATHGKNVLKSLFQDHGFALASGDQAEVRLTNLQLHKADVTGTLDSLHLEKSRAVITDYKTGTPLASFTTRDQTKAIKAWRHRTQLLFYILLARQSGRFRGVTNITARIVYVEAENQRQLIVPLKPEAAELKRLERLIAAVWQRLKQLDFPNTDDYRQTIEGIRAFEDDLLR